MSPNLAAGPQRLRATIIEELATVLRDADASTTNIESAIARTNVSMQEISATFGGKRELLLTMVSELSDAMSAPLTAATQTDLRQRLFEFGQCVTEVYTTSHLRGLYRIAITESIRHTGERNRGRRWLDGQAHAGAEDEHSQGAGNHRELT